MSDVIFGRAGPEDRDDCIDFAEFVFSQAHEPHDFLGLLPKLYKPEYFMEGTHYLAKEGGKIKALVGSYPIKYEFDGAQTLPGRGIGAVSVHHRSRSKGYMKVLMNMALEDMKKNGMTFSCLGGQRQRYEYFGYTHAGTRYYFTVREPNIRHTLGNEWKTDLALRKVMAEDKIILDQIQAIHDAKKAKLFRDRSRLFDILSSWYANIFAVTEGDRFSGYFVARPGSFDVVEINLNDLSRIPEIMGLFLRYLKERGGPDSVSVAAAPHETEKITVLSGFAENYRQTTAYQFNILNFESFVKPFLDLGAEQHAIIDGSIILEIKGSGIFALECKGGKAAISRTTLAPDLVLNELEAVQFLFNPVSPITSAKIRESLFLRSLLPLPLFFENLDGI